MADTTRVRVELMHGYVSNVEMAVYRTADDGGIRDEKMIWSGGGKCIGRFAWKGLQLADGLAAHREIFCFGKTADGTPRHTLMLPYTTKLVKFAVSTQLPAQEK